VRTELLRLGASFCGGIQIALTSKFFSRFLSFVNSTSTADARRTENLPPRLRPSHHQPFEGNGQQDQSPTISAQRRCSRSAIAGFMASSLLTCSCKSKKGLQSSSSD